MAVQSPPELDTVFRALADPTRRAMLERLAAAPCSIGELAAPFSLSQPTLSRHVGVLEAAGLVVCEPQSCVRMARLDAPPLAAATRWLTGFAGQCSARLDAEASDGLATLAADLKQELLEQEAGRDGQRR